MRTTSMVSLLRSALKRSSSHRIRLRRRRFPVRAASPASGCSTLSPASPLFARCAVFQFARVCALGAVLLAQATGAPQAPPPPTPAPQQPPQQPPPRFRVETNLVRVDAYATKNGVPVHDMTAADFEVFEDNAPQKIESFEHIVVDTGGPQSERVGAELGHRRQRARRRSAPPGVRHLSRPQSRQLRGLPGHQAAADRLHAAGDERRRPHRRDDAGYESVADYVSAAGPSRSRTS